MEDDHILEVKNLSISFNSSEGINTVVENVSFSLGRGETLGIVGESGSGKTVTSLAILNLISFSGGSIEKGRITYRPSNNQVVDLLSLSEKELSSVRGNKISMIFQEPSSSLNPNIRCGNQIEEALSVHSICTKEQLKPFTLDLLKATGILDPERIHQAFPHQLSGGQLQRVMIAMAISCDPDILIADEPTTSLDVTIQAEIMVLLNKIKKNSGLSCIFISHDLGVIKEIADRVLVLKKGRIVEYGDIEDIFSNPQDPYTKGLLACRPPLDKRLDRLPVLEDFSNGNPLPSYDIGLINADMYKKHLEHLQNNSVVLKINGLSKKYVAKRNFINKPIAYVQAIKNLDIEIRKGEIHGLVGESGCGKSTLARCIAQLENWDEGAIYYDSQDVSSMKSREKNDFRRRVQMIFQDPFSSLNPRITVGEAVMEPLRFHSIYSSDKERKEMVIELFKKVNLLPDYFDRFPHQFSGGEKQRVCIARALAVNPEFLICDEPVSSLDVSVQAQVLNLLSQLKKEHDFSMLFISHDLSVVKHLCDNVSVMSHGVIVERGDVEKVFNSPSASYTKKLLNAIPASGFNYQIF